MLRQKIVQKAFQCKHNYVVSIILQIILQILSGTRGASIV